VLDRSAAGSSGGFFIETDVGRLTNEYQGTSCKVRFIFRVARGGSEEEPTPYVPGTTIPLTPPEGEGRDYWSLLSLLMSAVAAAVSAMYTYGAYRRHRFLKRENERLLELGEEARKLSGGMWKALAIGCGAATPVIWLLLDNLRNPVALINANTKWVAVAVLMHLIGASVYLIGKNRERREEA
jgi:hypothetical protein